MKNRATVDTCDINAAIAIAVAYLRLSEPHLNGIKNINESSHPHSLSEEMANSVAAATNLAFAIELLIKSILYVSRVEPPQGADGHNLSKLYELLPQHFKKVIEHHYKERRKKDWNGVYRSITFSLGPQSAGVPRWDDKGSGSFDIAALLGRSQDIFTSWRYLYEFRTPETGEWQFFRLEYCLRLSACRAMRDAIKLARDGAIQLTIQ